MLSPGSPGSPGSPSVRDSARRRGWVGGRAGIAKEKTEPTSRVLWTWIVPPISSTSRLEMASPRPLPPNGRAAVLSAWEKGLKSRS